ncbi:hypothetical protein [Neptunomonas concharum]|uniref:Sulfotransferase domain-containing protein n=1 Tax=Neptunomonas concharum TaxID=1031538 RepID=A0A5P1R8B2_9GAMM|nr:hypothetical protein [Neptunomonas concharum]QEQ95874.1 hypothetical protein F0U83_03670 [Neptunomonas concharum]
MEINLHLGIHKTATTYLQDQLTLSRDLLKNNGIQYFSLSEMRSGLTQAIRNKPLDVIQHILRETIQQEKVILSDENMIGNAGEIRKGINYKPISDVIGKIRQSLPESKVSVLISLRNPLEFLPSIYCEYLRHNNFVSYENYIANQKDALNWEKLLTPVINSNRDINFLIFNFDNFRNNKKEILKAISFNSIDRYSNNINSSRATLSTKVIELLSNFPETSKELLTVIENLNYVFGDKFKPYSEQELRKSKEVYLSQLNNLSKLKNTEVFF